MLVGKRKEIMTPVDSSRHVGHLRSRAEMHAIISRDRGDVPPDLRAKSPSRGATAGLRGYGCTHEWYSIAKITNPQSLPT